MLSDMYVMFLIFLVSLGVRWHNYLIHAQLFKHENEAGTSFSPFLGITGSI